MIIHIKAKVETFKLKVKPLKIAIYSEPEDSIALSCQKELPSRD